ncbi:creatininase family protein [Sporomusa malonica]|uniref:Creatinine amidohydrolase n=1 Tax=Sporomusa malonica TaxID=112901 RepID=A0A1W1Y7N5_9FIRM|nr:creatininase family protein [Sporomusa malonica]SMC32182.1 creatinine amidohydrolase [Sporomusa malonica]
MERHVSRLTWEEVRDLDKHTGALILPIGSLEQHGPHLPVDTDLFFTEQLLDLTLAKLPDQVTLWRLPVLPISKSNEHASYPGTLSLSATTMMAVLHDIAQGVVNAGFRRLVFWTCHGGNRALLEVIAREVRIATGLMTFVVFPPAVAADPVQLDEQEQALGIHAGDWETSVMLALARDKVRLDKLDCSYPELPASSLQLELAGATFAWTTSDWSPSGTWGNARRATAERGTLRLSAILPRLVTILTDICHFEVSR